MTVATIMDSVNEITKMKERLVEELKNSTQEQFQFLFEGVGDHVDGVSWTQYTPYFNDGDACEFGISGAGAFPFKEVDGVPVYLDGTTGKPVEDGYNYPDDWDLNYSRQRRTEDGKWEDVSNPQPDLDSLRKNATALVNALFEADVLKALYGDHVSVFVYKDGRVVTEEFDHD